MIIPNIWENKKWQPNHQPEIHIGSRVSHLQIPPFGGPWHQQMTETQQGRLRRQRSPGAWRFRVAHLGCWENHRTILMGGVPSLFDFRWIELVRHWHVFGDLLFTGWWLYTHPSEKYEFVNWDDEIPNIWEIKKWQPNHQPAYIFWWDV